MPQLHPYLILIPAQHNDRIMSAEAKGIGDPDLQIRLTGMVRNIIQVAQFVRLLQIDCRRNQALLHAFEQGDSFRPPAAPRACPVIDLFAVTGIR